uniref:Uncharacterized protein n=1 Tax=Arundo donax TaxID=35708 RepID=A0A0A9C0H4_ARUDO
MLDRRSEECFYTLPKTKLCYSLKSSFSDDRS